MNKLITYFIERSLLVNLLSFIILVGGVISAFSLKKDVFPNVNFEVIFISTVYPGSSPEDVEKLLSIEIERALKGVNGIKELNAISLESRSMVFVKVDPDYNMETVLTDVKGAIDNNAIFPDEVDSPSIKMLTSSEKSILKIALTGDDELKMREVSKDLRDQLENLKGVSRVDIDGYRQQQILVEVFPEKLNYYQITVDEIIRSIKESNLNLSAGKIETPTEDILIQTRGEFQGIDDIKKTVIRSNTTGSQVTISQVANVQWILNSSSVFQRIKGKRSIFLDVKKKITADVIQTSDSVKKILNEYFSKKENKDTGFVIVDELAHYVKRRLSVLTSNGLFGLLLVIGALMLFLNFRVSLITTFGAPLAFLTSFIIMESFGISFNLISMFGLILVLGMLVDDAIIVAENFYQHIEKGVEPREAAAIAAKETILPVTATILTTMIAFGSLFFMGGIMGKFLWLVPAVVIICLLASWLECFLILPSHLADFGKGRKPFKQKHRWYDSLKNLYKKALGHCIKHYILTFFSFFGVLILSFMLASTMRFELFPGDDVREVIIKIQGKVGDPLQQTETAIIKTEGILNGIIRKDELRTLRGVVGSQIDFKNPPRQGPHYGGFILYLTDPSARERSTDEILDEISKKLKPALPDYKILTEKLVGGPPRGKPVDIQLKSDSLNDLKAASDKVVNLLKNTKGVLSVAKDFEDGKIKIMVDVNKTEAKRLGMSNAQIALALRKAYGATSITEIRKSDEDIEIIVKLEKKFRTRVDLLKNFYLLNNQGRRIPLSRVASFKRETGAFIIRRLDRKRTISVNGDINKELTTPMAIARELRPKIQQIIQQYPGMSFEQGGENKDTQESMARLLKSGGIALGAIFLILVAIFGSLGQSIVILSTIPLGFIGVVITFKILGMSLGFMAMMGVIGLVGVVVNDSIVLVNFINKKRQEGKELLMAIAEAAESRFRPIILTSITTIGGLLPIAHARGGDPFLKPMAVSFAWGLMFSTMVTLLFIPCAYIINEKVKALSSRLMKRKV